MVPFIPVAEQLRVYRCIEIIMYMCVKESSSTCMAVYLDMWLLWLYGCLYVYFVNLYLHRYLHLYLRQYLTNTCMNTCICMLYVYPHVLADICMCIYTPYNEDSL